MLRRLSLALFMAFSAVRCYTAYAGEIMVIRPGQLSEAEKAQRYQELTRDAMLGLGPRPKSAAQQRKEWLDELEKKYGVYDVTTILNRATYPSAPT